MYICMHTLETIPVDSMSVLYFFVSDILYERKSGSILQHFVSRNDR